ncbi:MAG: glycosyltransferase family 2 protein [Candidatus Omnitrophica bacterium]|nr:glycosyltransferase family 2 protein [Candidatus Omnitrophota bacterium]
MKPELSVIVAAFDCEQTIMACLEAIRQSKSVVYELIVVDDGSHDNTCQRAGKYADTIVRHPRNIGRFEARMTGMRHAEGALVVNVDADVLIRHDSLRLIRDYFKAHPEINAVTGLLSKEHPHSDYFSQYKNLYMHYCFRRLPDQVSFLYGSIFAIRRDAIDFSGVSVRVADDTELGQMLVSRGKRIGMLKELEVIHLKRFDFGSWLINDFRIPHDWARIFVKYQGWKKMGQSKRGFAHASMGQIVSMILAVLIFLGLVSTAIYPVCVPGLTGFLAFIWVMLNRDFLRYLRVERGVTFAVAGLFVTFMDHLVMMVGVITGVCSLIYAPIGSKTTRGALYRDKT